MQLEHLKNIEDLNRLRLPFTLERIKMSKLRFLQNIIIFQLKKFFFNTSNSLRDMASLQVVLWWA